MASRQASPYLLRLFFLGLNIASSLTDVGPSNPPLRSDKFLVTCKGAGRKEGIFISLLRASRASNLLTRGRRRYDILFGRSKDAAACLGPLGESSL